MKTNRTSITGYVLLSISILILVLVLPFSDRIADLSAVLYVMVLIIGFPFACFGSALVVGGLPTVGKGGYSHGVLIFGIFISILGVILWVGSLITAFYPLGDMAILHVIPVFSAIPVGLFGGWLIGLGLPGRKRVEIDEQG